MRALLNDVDNCYEGRLEILDVAPSKKEFCRRLGCGWCRKGGIRVEGHPFGLVYPKDTVDKGWGNVSMINSSCAPDFCGSYLIFGVDKSGKLTDLTHDEIVLLMEHFSLEKRKNGRGKYILFVDM